MGARKRERERKGEGMIGIISPSTVTWARVEGSEFKRHAERVIFDV